MGTTTAAPDKPSPRPQLPLWKRVMVWIIRAVLVYLIVLVVRNPWPLLRMRTFPALLLWIIFFVYWAIAGRNSAPTKSSESTASTYFHQIILNIALILLFWPAPGLKKGWFLPQQLRYLVVVGAVVQGAFIFLAVAFKPTSSHTCLNYLKAVVPM